MMTDAFLAILTLHLAALSGISGQKFDFQNGISFNETCSLNPHTDWSTHGSVTLTPADFALFQQKLIIRAFHDICDVDLTACPPDQAPTSGQSCFCQSRQDDTYTIKVASRLDTGRYAGMTVQAVVPGRGPLKEINGAVELGKLPVKTDILSRINATYKIDDGEERDLKYSQNVSVCPQKRTYIEICMHNGRPGADLQIIVDEKTTSINRTCIDSVVSSSGSKAITFVYNDHVMCRQIHRIFLNDDAEVCARPTPCVSTSPSSTTPVATSTSRTTESTSPSSTTPVATSTSRPTESTTSTSHIEGVCPPTPRTLTTLPSGLQTLTDDVSFNTSWVVIQRRINTAVDFNRPWADYVAGFGDVTGSFWIGLKKINEMCNTETRCRLLVHMKYAGTPFTKSVAQRADECYFSRYSQFWLGDAEQKYTLHVAGYTGTGGDSLTPSYSHNWNNDNQPFTTIDQDNDQWSGNNCAEKYAGGWWYARCGNARLNSVFGLVHDGQAAYWYTLTGRNSVQFSELKVAPRS